MLSYTDWAIGIRPVEPGATGRKMIEMRCLGQRVACNPEHLWIVFVRHDDEEILWVHFRVPHIGVRCGAYSYGIPQGTLANW